MKTLFSHIDLLLSAYPDILCWGATTADPPDHGDILIKWLSDAKHGEMSFMENNLSLRLNPTQFFPGAESTILFLYRYPEPICTDAPATAPLVSAYAQGVDYHITIKRVIGEIEKELLASDASIALRGFIDSAPVMERDLAVRAGLGWIGKNGSLIHPQLGSQFFIGGFFINKVVEKESRTYPDGCAACRKCIDACPTQAIEEGRVIDARRCISYLTIEKKGEIDPELASKMGSNIFGCDICLAVCPWNKKHMQHSATTHRTKFLNSFEEWQKLLEMGGGFKSHFKNTPLYRAGRPKMVRNLSIAKKNSALE